MLQHQFQQGSVPVEGAEEKIRSPVELEPVPAALRHQLAQQVVKLILIPDVIAGQDLHMLLHQLCGGNLDVFQVRQSQLLQQVGEIPALQVVSPQPLAMLPEQILIVP